LASPLQYEILQQLNVRVAKPVLFLHAGGNDSDAAVALELGAADTLGTPFQPQDLALRLNMLLDKELSEGHIIRRGELVIDPLRRVVHRGDQKMALASAEWGLLLLLAQKAGRAMPEELLTQVWGHEYKQETDYLDLWIRRLRVNLGDDPSYPSVVLGDLTQGFSPAD
jgi:DNA-binding response OmpR family regulator